jgi:hypothetical protein
VGATLGQELAGGGVVAGVRAGQQVQRDGLLAGLVGHAEGHPVGELFEWRAVGVDLDLVSRVGVEALRRVGPCG